MDNTIEKVGKKLEQALYTSGQSKYEMVINLVRHHGNAN